jgi:hypothetical protein
VFRFLDENIVPGFEKIGDEAMASEAYFPMGEKSDPAQLSRLRKALLECCRQESLFLFRLLE